MMGELHLNKCRDGKTMDSFKVDFLVYQDEAHNIPVCVDQMEELKSCVDWSDWTLLLSKVELCAV